MALCPKVSFVVRKYGGSSLATFGQIRAAAEELSGLTTDGTKVVVVVSAMGDTTDRLVALAGQVAERPDSRELDQLMATGEQVSAALLAMALIEHGVCAVSLTGDQAGIVVRGRPGAAVIERVDAARILERLRHWQIVVVTGFQGLDDQGELRTLGRGGSDITAVALAAALGWRDCEIRTDAHGVRTADPRIVADTRPVPTVPYDAMAELADRGAKVLHPSSVQLAARHGVRVHVAHTAPGGSGTIVTAGEPRDGGHRVVGIAHERDLWMVRLEFIGTDGAWWYDAVLAKLAERGVLPDVLTRWNPAELRFTVRGGTPPDVPVGEVATEVGAHWSVGDGLGSVSVIGVGLLDHPWYLATMLRTLGELRLVVPAMVTSPSRFTAVVPAGLVDPAVRALHGAFGLAAPTEADR